MHKKMGCQVLTCPHRPLAITLESVMGRLNGVIGIKQLTPMSMHELATIDFETTTHFIDWKSHA